MRTIRRATSVVILITLLLLCLCAPACAKKEQTEALIPASSEAVLEELPAALPPLPVVTLTESEPDSKTYEIKGLDAWPLDVARMKKRGLDELSGAYRYIPAKIAPPKSTSLLRGARASRLPSFSPLIRSVGHCPFGLRTRQCNHS